MSFKNKCDFANGGMKREIISTWDFGNRNHGEFTSACPSLKEIGWFKVFIWLYQLNKRRRKCRKDYRKLRYKATLVSENGRHFSSIRQWKPYHVHICLSGYILYDFKIVSISYFFLFLSVNSHQPVLVILRVLYF